MKLELLWPMILVSALVSNPHAWANGPEHEPAKLSPQIKEARALLLSSDAKVRVSGAKLLEKLEYQDLLKVDLLEGCAAHGPCDNFNYMAYHLIGLYGRFAKEETNPKSPNFCYQRSNTTGAECPYLSKLRWLVYNQFDETFLDSVKDRKVSPEALQKLALDAIKAATKLNPKVPQDLQALPVKSAENENLKWLYVEMPTNQGIYATPVVHHFLWDKATKRFLQKSHLLPFTHKKGSGAEYANDPLSVRWVDDLVLIPGTDLGILRKDGECCGNDNSLFHIFSVTRSIKALGVLQIETLEFPKTIDTWSRVKPVFEKIGFIDAHKAGKLVSSSGEIELGGKSVKFKLTPENKPEK